MGSSLAAGLHALDVAHGPGDPEPARGLDPEAGGRARGSSPADWGWEASASEVSAAVIALADQPLVGAEVVRRLIAAYDAGAAVVVAAYDGKPRNPVLIDREYWAAVLEMAVGDTGARPFLRAHPTLVTLRGMRRHWRRVRHRHPRRPGPRRGGLAEAPAGVTAGRPGKRPVARGRCGAGIG